MKNSPCEMSFQFIFFHFLFQCILYSKSDKKKKSPTDKRTLTVDVDVDESCYNVAEGETLSLKWKLSGIFYENNFCLTSLG